MTQQITLHTTRGKVEVSLRDIPGHEVTIKRFARRECSGAYSLSTVDSWERGTARGIALAVLDLLKQDTPAETFRDLDEIDDLLKQDGKLTADELERLADQHHMGD